MTAILMELAECAFMKECQGMDVIRTKDGPCIVAYFLDPDHIQVPTTYKTVTIKKLQVPFIGQPKATGTPLGSELARQTEGRKCDTVRYRYYGPIVAAEVDD